MATTLYLIETRAAKEYICPGCNQKIPRGSRHFRHDPHPYARSFRGLKTSHWCYECITTTPSSRDSVGRVWIRPAHMAGLFRPDRRLAQVEVVGVGTLLAAQIAADPGLIHRLEPGQFEEFVCDRLSAMGLEPKHVGDVNRKDGGIDVLFWPKAKGAFPFLGAAQIKHHKDPRRQEGPSTVRDFAGAISGHPFGAALFVTNTAFTPDAEWFAREHARLVRLRGLNDIRRWVVNNFADEAEWREIPSEIELCPGVAIKVR